LLPVTIVALLAASVAIVGLYPGKVPEKIALYQPYPSANCLHCYDDARRFQEAIGHQPFLGELYAGRRSCLGCHNVAHDMSSVAASRFWQADAR
jgi:hypothetical protein